MGGLLHYVNAASNHTAKGYRRGVRGKELYRMAIHRTGIYQSRFADYIIRDVYGSHRAWRTSQRMDPHARAPHHHDAAAQTDCFELALDYTAQRWDGASAIHVSRDDPGRGVTLPVALPVAPGMLRDVVADGRLTGR